MPEFISRGVTLYYEEAGKGEPLLFLHGLTASHNMFKQEVEYFKGNFRVITLDSRGHGLSDKPLNYTIGEHIEDVIALMDYLKIERVHLLGMSMGSYIAQGVAIEQPNRVEKLILVSSKSNGKTSSMQELFARHADELEGLDYQEKIDQSSKYIFHNLSEVGKWMNEIGPDEIVLTPEQQAAANKALEGFDFRLALPTVTAKTLVISGTYDGLNPPEQGAEIAGLIPNASFIEFENSGHSPDVEETERFLDVVMDFLEKK